MTGQKDNVGLLATESGVQEFQLSPREWCVFGRAPHNSGENPPYAMNRGGGENNGRTRELFATNNITISRQIERVYAREGGLCPAICTPFALLQS